MGDLKKCAFAFSLIWCLLCMQSLFSAQELDHFETDTSVNFDRDQVLAEIEPQDSNNLTTEVYYSKPSNITTPHLRSIITGSTGSDPDSKSKATTRRADDVYTPRENAGKSGSGDGATVPELRVTMKNKEAIKSAYSSKTTFDTSLNDVENGLMETPPHIVWPISQNRITIPEQNHALAIYRCLASGNPTPTFKWLRDGAPINNSEYLQAYDNGTLVFRTVSNREEGIYQCMATNSLGTSVSVTVPILLERPPESLPSTIHSTKNYDAKEGDPMSFGCVNVRPGVPAYTKRWYFSYGTTELNETIRKRVDSDTNGVLRFAYLEKSDSASYVCAQAPEVAAARDTIKLYNTAILKVKEHAQTTLGATLAYVSGNVKAVLGKTATLECFFYGNPVPKITWKRASRNEEIKTGDKKFDISQNYFGRRLVIADVQAEDADSYICVGDNGFGIVEGITVVNVTSPPVKVPNGGLNTIVKPDGGDHVLKCKAKVVGLQSMSTPQWYKNGEPFNESSLPYPNRYSFNDDQTELTIRGLNKEEDTACFQCNISNSEGYLFYDGYLRVINSIKIDKAPSDTAITNSSVLDIAVRASGDSCCKINQRWYLNEQLLADDELQQPPFDYRNGGNHFMFDASKVSNEALLSKVGNYMCVLFNGRESRNVTFTISMKAVTYPTPEPLKAAEAGMPLWWIGIVCGILLIIIAIIVIVIFVKSNYPGDTYLLEKAEIKHNLNPQQDLLDQSFHEV